MEALDNTHGTRDGRWAARSDIDAVKQIQIATAKDRLEFLRRLGMRIHREPVYKDVRITVTGSEPDGGW